MDPAHPLPRRQPLLDASSTSSGTRCRTPCTPRMTTHCPGFVDGGPYPGETRGEYVDRDRRRGDLPRPHRVHAARPAPPSGSASSVPSTPATRPGRPAVPPARRTSSRSTTVTARAGRCGPTRTSACRAWCTPIRTPRTCERIAPVLEKKARLGVDAWGSTDTACARSSSRSRSSSEGVPRLRAVPVGSHAMDPRTRPPRDAGRGDGRRLRRRLRGRAPDEAAVLAESFAFGECLVREPLAKILGGSAAGND